MSKFFDDTLQRLMQAIEIEKRIFLLQSAVECQHQLFRCLAMPRSYIAIRKKNHSPSLQTFCNILDALGYGLMIEKKAAI